MNDIHIIDATGGKFTQKRFNEFCSYIKKEDESIYIIVDEIDKSVNFAQLRAFLEMPETVELFKSNQNKSCCFGCENALLTVDTNDVLWWLKQKDGKFTRTEKLFSEVQIDSVSKKNEKSTKTSTSSTTTKRGQIYKIAAGIQIGNDINELELFEGDNKSSVAFINKYYSKALIRSKFDESQVVKFVVNYTHDDDLCISANWKTIDQLEFEGVVKLA